MHPFAKISVTILHQSISGYHRQSPVLIFKWKEYRHRFKKNKRRKMTRNGSGKKELSLHGAAKMYVLVRFFCELRLFGICFYPIIHFGVNRLFKISYSNEIDTSGNN